MQNVMLKSVFQKWSISRWANRLSAPDTWARGAWAPVGKLEGLYWHDGTVVVTSHPPRWGATLAAGTTLAPWSSSSCSSSSLPSPPCPCTAAAATPARSLNFSLEDVKTFFVQLLTEDSGVITDGPRGANYTENSHCEWLIQPRSKYRWVTKLWREWLLCMEYSESCESFWRIYHYNDCTTFTLECLYPDSYPFDSRVLPLNVPMTMSSSLMDPGKTTSENDSLQHNFNQQGSRLDGCLMIGKFQFFTKKYKINFLNFSAIPPLSSAASQGKHCHHWWVLTNSSRNKLTFWSDIRIKKDK